MNEHDSERLAGLLVADGLVAAANDAEADVVVLNTCTIRENADLKLYSALGQLKALKESRPGMQIAVGGCMAQKDRGHDLGAGQLGRRRLWHPQSQRRPLLLRRASVKGP
jgi:tRNA A37 methylthiotransferase MiaB